MIVQKYYIIIKQKSKHIFRKFVRFFVLKALTYENMFDIINNHKEQMFPTNVRIVCSSIYYYRNLSERKR